MLVIDDMYLKAAGLNEPELKLEIAIMLFGQERLSLRKAKRATIFPTLVSC